MNLCKIIVAIILLNLTAIEARGQVKDASEQNHSFEIRSIDGYCQISITTSNAPQLTEWAEKKLGPVLAQWYPKLVALLPSDGYNAPTNFGVNIRPGNGVAATGRNRITANATWIERELNGQAVGALLHEEVHVVQQYRGGRGNPDYKRPPGWLVEGFRITSAGSYSNRKAMGQMPLISARAGLSNSNTTDFTASPPIS